MTTGFRSDVTDIRIIFRFVTGIIILLCLLTVVSCSPQEATYCDIAFEGGTGRAYVRSPVKLVKKDGKTWATLVFSSRNYDYVLVDGERYDNENPGEDSTFTVPVKDTDEPFVFFADTVAMSTPHEIEYKITWLKGQDGAEPEKTGEGSGTAFGRIRDDGTEAVLPGMEETGRMELSHAEGFCIKEYGEYRLISIYGAGDYLLVPENGAIPQGISDDITVIMQPLDRTCLVSTSVMDLVRQIGALDKIRLSGLEAKGWYIDEAREYMEQGKIVYAGKYRAPDYELILSEGCDLAIENTMIFHDPEVREKLEELGIPVLVETSSYEKDPLGRLEWIKLYGVLFGREKEAEDFFRKEEKKILDAGEAKSSGKKTAFFSVTAQGAVNVREPGDYIAKMIEMSGGDYIPEAAGNGAENGGGTRIIQMEDFYSEALDADILIYNSTIDGELHSVEELIEKDAIFADFRAVKEGNVYCLRKDFFQKTTGIADFLLDLRKVMDGKGEECRFIYRLYE